jgi:Sec-independent protein translocase protein TatA
VKLYKSANQTLREDRKNVSEIKDELQEVTATNQVDKTIETTEMEQLLSDHKESIVGK